MRNGSVEVLDTAGRVVARGSVLVTRPVQRGSGGRTLAWRAKLSLPSILPAKDALVIGSTVTLRWADGSTEECGVFAIAERARGAVEETIATLTPPSAT